MNHHDDILNYIVGCLLHRKMLIEDNDNTCIMEIMDNMDEWKDFYEEIQNSIDDELDKMNVESE
jgi:hypothetical protein